MNPGHGAPNRSRTGRVQPGQVAAEPLGRGRVRRPRRQPGHDQRGRVPAEHLGHAAPPRPSPSQRSPRASASKHAALAARPPPWRTPPGRRRAWPGSGAHWCWDAGRAAVRAPRRRPAAPAAGRSSAPGSRPARRPGGLRAAGTRRAARPAPRGGMDQVERAGVLAGLAAVGVGHLAVAGIVFGPGRGRTSGAAASGPAASEPAPSGAGRPGCCGPSRAPGRTGPARTARSAGPGARTRRSRAGPAPPGRPVHPLPHVPVPGARAVHAHRPGQARPRQFLAQHHLGHGRAADVPQADQADPVGARTTGGGRRAVRRCAGLQRTCNQDARTARP